ncbi:MAG: ABC transporter ATP-binding protein [Candidatus Micrarchaeia archaeon]
MGEVVVERVSKQFGRKYALRDVSLKIPPGCVFCIAGPNGSGKTTLLNILAGVMKQSDGKVAVNGSVGYTYQHPKLWEELSVKENISFFSKLSERYDERWVRRAIEEMELGSLLDESVGELSSGMRKRVEIAVGILSNPDVVLLDEPTAGLDVGAKEKVIEIIKFFRKEGKTVVVTTHQLEDFGGVCDRLAVLKEGRVVLERDVRGVGKEGLLRIYREGMGKVK